MSAVLGWFMYGVATIFFAACLFMGLICILSVFDQTYREPGFRNNWDQWVGGFWLILVVPTLIGFLVTI